MASRTRFALLLVTALLGLFLLLPAAVFILVDEIDLSPHRAEVERLVGRLTGREISIGGELRAELSLSPAVSARSVRFASAQGASRPVMFGAERVEAQLDLIALLGGTLEAVRLVLEDADLSLERDATGRGNWDFSEDEPPPQKSAGGLGIGLPGQVDIDVSNFTLDYLDRRDGQSWKLHLSQATLRGERRGEPLEVAVEGRWNDLPLRINGTTGSLPELLTGKTPQPVQLQAEALGISAEARGTYSNPFYDDKIDLHVQARADTLDTLRDLLGLTLPSGAALVLEANLVDTPSQLDMDARIALGTAALEAQLALVPGETRPSLTGEVTVRGLDAGGFIPEPQSPPPSPGGEGGPPRLFSTEPLDLDFLKVMDVDLKLQGRNLTLLHDRAANISGRIKLTDGALAVDAEEPAASGQPLAVNLKVDGQSVPASFSFRAHDPDLDLASFLAATRAAGLMEGEVQVDVDLVGRGRSMAQVMGGLDGHVRLLMGQGRIDARELDQMVGGARAALGQLLSEDSKLAAVNCIACDLKVEGGQVAVRLGLLDTEYSTVVVQGGADLAQETLDLKGSPEPKGVTLSVAVPVHVTGPITDPSYTPEAGGALMGLTTLVTKIAYPPAALVGAFGDGAANNPCVVMAAGGDVQSQEVTKRVGGSVQRTLKGIGGILESAAPDEDAEKQD